MLPLLLSRRLMNNNTEQFGNINLYEVATNRIWYLQRVTLF